MKETGGIWMSKKGQFQLDTVSEFLQGRLSRSEAAQLLDTTERTITRIARRIESRGVMGVVHGNQGKDPWNKKTAELKASVIRLMQERYFDFNLCHALDQLKKEHGLLIEYDSLRRWCHEIGLVKRAKRRKPKARYKRVRMPCEGLLLQLDGTPYRFNGKDEWCLIAAIDDATSDIPYAEFFLSEDTLSCMTVLQKIIELRGIPYAIYVDKAGCLGGTGKRAHFNQFARACDELGIRIIKASSPEAKGRIERTWDTIQDRLPPELRLRNIKSMPAANHYLQTQFLPNYWRQDLRQPAKSPEIKYQPLPANLDLREVLCLKEYRSVARDHTISWQGKTYGLDSPVKYAIWGQKVEFRTYQDMSWKAFFAGRPIALREDSIPRHTKLVPHLVA